MHWFIILVLFAVAFLFAQSGAVFVAFLAVTALLLLMFNSKPSAPAGRVVGHTPEGAPIMVKSSAAKIPSTIKVKVKDPWGGTTSWEDTSKGIGEIANTFFGTLYRLATGEHEESDTDQNEGVHGR